MARQLWALLTLSSLQVACTVTAVSQGDDPRPNNSCTSDSECGQDSCSDGVCQALNGELEALLISATPPSDSGIPHLTFVAQVDDVPSRRGSQDLDLPGPSHVVGSLVLPKNADCYPGFASDDPKSPFLPADDGKTLPATVTLALSQRLLGLPQQLYFAATGIRNLQGSYSFEVQVPRGEYDVYLVPPPRQLGGCAVPPQLYRSFPIDSEDAEITFPLSSISLLPLSIRWPKSSPSLTGWSVDIIEPFGGNPISTEVKLGEAIDPGESSATVEYGAWLSYSTVVAPAAASDAMEVKAASDLLRLRPRANTIAPTIFMDRSGLGLLSDRKVVALDRFTQLPEPVQVESQLVRAEDGSPVAGYVTLVSTQIYGVDSGIFASYQTTIQVGVDGALHAVLPPGNYKVQAVPPALGGPSAAGALAALETSWEIPADVPVQYGKVLELSPIASVVGQTRFLGAQVQAVPSPRTILPFEEAFGEGRFGPFTPRAGIGLVDDAGKFAVAADPGLFDVSVQAPESLGFGWFVRPGVQVGDQDEDLGRVTPPRPALLSGTARVSVTGTGVPLGSAAIRAYAYLDKNLAYTRDAKQAVSVVQVAETRADETGAFRLLVPSRIAASK